MRITSSRNQAPTYHLSKPLGLLTVETVLYMFDSDTGKQYPVEFRISASRGYLESSYGAQTVKGKMQMCYADHYEDAVNEALTSHPDDINAVRYTFEYIITNHSDIPRMRWLATKSAL